MPLNNQIILPRMGHIDLPGDLINCRTALSVEERVTEDGQPVILLHIDVAEGGEIETPFSVGIPLTMGDVAVMLAQMAGVTQMMPPTPDWLN